MTVKLSNHSDHDHLAKFVNSHKESEVGLVFVSFILVFLLTNIGQIWKNISNVKT